jgi:RNA polymerase subunit RPABC4/transcription elongation factor Spt4
MESPQKTESRPTLQSFYITLGIYLKECKSAVNTDTCTPMKNNEFTLFAGKWTGLEIIVLSEMGQTGKDRYYMFSVICGI